MSYITTFSKIHIDPVNPDADLISIEDIAHALSYMTRANGHFPAFHSVAQHCIECAQEAKERGETARVQLACLLHDASEAYLADITRPVKAVLTQYKAVENQLLHVIYTKYLGGLTSEEEKKVKEIDDALLYYEFAFFMGEYLSDIAPRLASKPNFTFRQNQSFSEVELEYKMLFHQIMLGSKGILTP
ncbi:MAG: hypothetical protein ACI4C1_10295 [Lachnospiraceae bacterium]